MRARIALVTDAEDVAALHDTGLAREIRVIALTLRARLAARRAGIQYDDLAGAGIGLDRYAILSAARRFAQSWCEQPWVTRLPALSELSDWHGFPLLNMQRRHLFDWFAEFLSALAVGRSIIARYRPAEIFLAPRERTPGYWCTPADNWDPAALALIAAQNGIRVTSLREARSKIGPIARVREWLHAAWRASDRAAVASPTQRGSPGHGSYRSTASRRVLVVARGHHYWPAIETCALDLARSLHVIVASHDPIDAASQSRIEAAGGEIVDVIDLCDADVPDVSRQGVAALDEMDDDPTVLSYFTDSAGTPFWPLLRDRFRLLFSRDIPDTVRHLAAADLLLNAYDPNLVLAALCESGPDAAYPIAAQRRGIPSITLQHGLILDGNADGAAPAADVVAVWGNLTQRQLARTDGSNTARYPVVGCPAPPPSVSGVDVLRQLGLRDGPPVCLFLGALGWAANDVHRYSEEEILSAVLDLTQRVPGLQLIMRLHPGEDVAALRELAEERGADAIIQPDAPLESLLSAGDVVVTQTTTAGLWAMRAGLPVVYLNAHCERDWLPFARSGAALGVYELEDLAIAVRRAIDDGQLRRTLAEGAGALVTEALDAVGVAAAARMTARCHALMLADAPRAPSHAASTV